MKSKKVVIPLGEGENISGVLSVPLGIASAGYITMRFNFPYKEKGKKAPDPQRKLEQTWLSVFDYFQKESGFSADRICEMLTCTT